MAAEEEESTPTLTSGILKDFFQIALGFRV